MTNRVATTDKGRKLQVQLHQDIQNESSLMKTPRTPFDYNSVQEPITSPSSNSLLRAGYFRPKQASHLILKTQTSPRTYPNYMRSDPREYPNKHECTWTPQATISGRKDLTAVSPLAHDIHHTIYRPQNSQNTATTIRELNKIVSGEHGHVTLNLTACDYPNCQPVKFDESSLTMRDSVLTPLNSKKILANKTASSDFFTPEQTSKHPFPKSLILKLPLTDNATPNRMESSASGRSMNPYLTNRKRQTIMLTTNTFDTKTYRTATKVTEEKAGQIVENFEEKQRDYNELLVKLNQKAKIKYHDHEDNSHYFAQFRSTFSSKGKVMDEISVANSRELQRYKLRLKERGEKKFGKYWDEWSGFLNKANKANISAGAPTPTPKAEPQKAVKFSVVSSPGNESFPTLYHKDSRRHTEFIDDSIALRKLDLKKVTSRMSGTTAEIGSQSRVLTS